MKDLIMRVPMDKVRIDADKDVAWINLGDVEIAVQAVMHAFLVGDKGMGVAIKSEGDE